MPSELCSSFFQGQVRLLRNHRNYALCLLFQWRNAAAPWLRRGAPTFTPALHPLDDRTHTDDKMLGGSCRDAPASTISITRSRKSQEYDFGIGTPRVRESMLKQSPIHDRLGIPDSNRPGAALVYQPEDKVDRPPL
jgi:hypothetical protein